MWKQTQSDTDRKIQIAILAPLWLKKKKKILVSVLHIHRRLPHDTSGKEQIMDFLVNFKEATECPSRKEIKLYL